MPSVMQDSGLIPQYCQKIKESRGSLSTPDVLTPKQVWARGDSDMAEQGLDCISCLH